MQNQKVYLLAELTVHPEFLDVLKAILKEAFIPTLQEPGCEAIIRDLTGRQSTQACLL